MDRYKHNIRKSIDRVSSVAYVDIGCWTSSTIRGQVLTITRLTATPRPVIYDALMEELL